MNRQLSFLFIFCLLIISLSGVHAASEFGYNNPNLPQLIPSSSSSGGGGNISGTGTSGYLARFYNGTSISSSVVFQSGASIGIGTVSPGYSLEVNGTGQILSIRTNELEAKDFGHIALPLISARSGVRSDTGNLDLYSLSYNVTFFTDKVVITNPGLVGIGTKSPTHKLTVNGTMNITGNSILNHTLFVTGDRVGIGTPTPSFHLSFSSLGAVIGISNNTGSGTSGSLTITAGTGTGGSNTGGNLLLKAGNSYTGSTETAGDVQIYAGNNTYAPGVLYGGAIRLYSAGGIERVTILSNGSVGIGTGSPTYTLTVNGTVAVRVGTSTTYARTGGVFFDNLNDSSNVGTAETSLQLTTLNPNILSTNFDKVKAVYVGNVTGVLTSTRQIKVYAFNQNIFDTGALSFSGVGDFRLEVLIMRKNDTAAESYVALNTPGASTSLYTKHTALAGLNFTTTNQINVTGQAAGVGAGNDQIFILMSTGNWEPSSA